MNIQKVLDTLMTEGPKIGLKIVGAIILWIIGKWLIGIVMKLVNKGLQTKNVDGTLSHYICSVLSVLLTMMLVVAMLGFFGVDTTTFAALLAGAGLAIGTAWSGLLANFASGVFIMLLRPYKVGDYVTIGGVNGTVREIGIFVTHLDTPDNVRTIVGNKKAFEDNIENFHANPYRRVDLVAQLAHGTDPNQAIQLLKSKVSQIPNVLSSPAPDVEVLEFNLAGPVLAVRPYCHTDNYWQVYFETNACIRNEFGKAGFSTPETHYNIGRAS